jgi:hypothetical protein
MSVRFPYESPELTAALGIPDSPAIHLAIATLADRLIPLAAGSAAPSDDVRIVAIRTASGGVLESMPIECVELRFLAALDLPYDDAACTKALETTTDWLGQAIARIAAEGLGSESPDPHAMATRYGWRTAADDPTA